MELALLLYAASIAENIKGTLTPFIWVFALLALVSAIAAAVTALHMEHEEPFTVAEQQNVYATPKDEKEEKFQSLRKASRLLRRASIWLIVAWFVTFGVSALIPKKSDVYVIAGGYVALKAARSEVVQSASNSVLVSIENWLDKELERNKRINDAKSKKERK